MKLPLYIHYDYFSTDMVCDADKHVVCVLRCTPSNQKFLRALVQKFNRDWRWRLFGWQPFEYTRDDWLYEKSPPPNYGVRGVTTHGGKHG